jgi:hypothetical protein
LKGRSRRAEMASEASYGTRREKQTTSSGR